MCVLSLSCTQMAQYSLPNFFLSGKILQLEQSESPEPHTSATEIRQIQDNGIALNKIRVFYNS